MGLAPYENLRGFASSKPPIVVFMICLGLFAIVLMTLGYYVKMSELRNPDVSQDWNMFLESFSDLDFCILGNTTEPVTTTTAPVTKATTQGQKAKESPTPTEYVSSTLTPSEMTRNYSVPMLLTVQPTRDFLNVHHNLTHLSGSIMGHEIGLKGSAEHEAINMTMDLPYEWNNTRCTALNCPPIQIYTCVHFQGNANVFPRSRTPEVCEALNETITGIEYSAQIKANKPFHYTSYYCQHRTMISTKYKLDPGLSVWLTLREKSAINLHLLHTSYFLMVMVITLFCYAIIRGKPLKSKITQTDMQHSLMSSEA